ncbi:ParB/RepB/Spo0J family partition protein [Candidatus Saccharibacteria bacterium TM7i]|nr:ParB/RepB/Spo0J family partition protein [Candidatus Saccharibacteria bacterium TM7i]
MSAAKKGLGRGFESLIPTDLIDDSFNPMAVAEKQVTSEGVLSISRIEVNPDQPRRTFDPVALEELSASIKEHGVLQPILVTPLGGSVDPDEALTSGAKYQIVAGERRFRASKMAGLKEIPVVIRTMSDQHQLEVSLIENIQRRDLNAIETAVGYAKLRDQFNLTNEQIAKRVNKSVSAVVNTMRLLKLPQDVATLIAEGKLTEGQARPLIGQDPVFLSEIVPKIVAEGWSARKIEQYISDVKRSGEEAAEKNDDTADEHVMRIAEQGKVFAGHLGERLNAKVDVKLGVRGSGKIVIGFKTPEELERIQKLLGE